MRRLGEAADDLLRGTGCASDVERCHARTRCTVRICLAGPQFPDPATGGSPRYFRVPAALPNPHSARLPVALRLPSPSRGPDDREESTWSIQSTKREIWRERGFSKLRWGDGRRLTEIARTSSFTRGLETLLLNLVRERPRGVVVVVRDEGPGPTSQNDARWLLDGRGLGLASRRGSAVDEFRGGVSVPERTVTRRMGYRPQLRPWSAVPGTRSLDLQNNRHCDAQSPCCWKTRIWMIPWDRDLTGPPSGKSSAYPFAGQQIGRRLWDASSGTVGRPNWLSNPAVRRSVDGPGEPPADESGRHHPANVREEFVTIVPSGSRRSRHRRRSRRSAARSLLIRVSLSAWFRSGRFPACSLGQAFT